MNDTEKALRGLIAQRCGGVDFDAPGGGYAFSDILEEERVLSEENIPDDPSSALLALSIADPTWKMPRDAMGALIDYYDEYPYATRYTDNSGAKFSVIGGKVANTQDALSVIKDLCIPSPDHVQYLPGSIKRALGEIIPTLLFDEKSILIFPTPGYPVIKSEMNKMDACVIDVPMEFKAGQWSFDFDEMGKQAGLISLKTAKRFVYMSIPNNPTSVAFSRDQWESIFSWAESNNMYLIIDEAYETICYREDAVSVLTVPGWEDRCIVLQSISKGWNATGARFGWIVAHPILVKGFRKVIDVKDSGGFGPVIAAAMYCLRHREIAEETRGRYQALHQMLYEGLVASGFETQMPDGGLCQLTPAPRSVDGTEFGSVIECAQWFREKLRISLMHYEVSGDWYLRWAVTLQPIPECNLPTEESVIEEVVRRLEGVEFKF